MQEYQNAPRFQDSFAREENRHQLIEIRGRIPMVGISVDLSATLGRVWGGAPGLGQHTEEARRELGYSWDAIETLKEKSCSAMSVALNCT